jgi:hypothetical protein
MVFRSVSLPQDVAHFGLANEALRIFLEQEALVDELPGRAPHGSQGFIVVANRSFSDSRGSPLESRSAAVVAKGM